MKYVIIHGDGMADWPCPELEGKTPLEAAHKPHMDFIAAHGILGLVHTIPEGMAPGSDIGTMSILGYDPVQYHTGRAPIEAASQGIKLSPDDVVFRMNLVTISENAEKQLVMEDFTAGHITSEEAAELVRYLANQLPLGSDLELYSGVSYRHLLVWRNGSSQIRTTPPHDIIGKPIDPYLPQGERAEVLNILMAESQNVLRHHPINLKRQQEGKPKATAVWFWGQGRAPQIPTFEERFGLKGAVISAVDLVNGLGVLAGLERIRVPGATGYLDTDYAAKGRYALEALKRHDFLLVHIEAPDEAGHMGRPDLKAEAIERIDELIVGPLLKGLPELGEFRLLVMPDHPTPCKLKTHSNEPVPFAIIDSTKMRVHSKLQRRYTEKDALQSSLIIQKGYRLIEELLINN